MSVHKFSLKAKLIILSIFILTSLAGIAMVGYNNITAMKKNLDSLYFGSLVPIATLNEITHIYNHDIKDQLYQNRDKRVLSQEIPKTLVQINKLWNIYAKSFKKEKELAYIEYTEKLIYQNESNLLEMMELCFRGCDESKFDKMDILEGIQKLENAISSLISYENRVAKYQRHTLLVSYDETVFRMSFIFVAIVIIIMLLSFFIFKSINLTQNRLKQVVNELHVSNKKLKNASYTDALTSLYNRRYFNLIYERELRRAKRSKSTISFMMLDIDFFKQYNDTYGHLEGDKALISVAKILNSLLQRPDDYVFRLGGEEFGVLLSQSTKESASHMAQKINNAVIEAEIPHAGSKVNKYLSISIGLVVVHPTMDLNNEKLLSEADKNLYEAKESGRNRYVVSEI